MNLEQYDKWVIGNQKRILDWTKMHSKERYAPIRDAFTAYHRAKSNKQKIEAFEKLKESFVSGKGVKFDDLVNNTFKPAKEDVQKAADKFTKGDIDALDRNNTNKKLTANLKIYDDLSALSDAMSSIPSKEESYDWVELDKAYEDHYNVKELTALAKKYGYDYSDKNERSEFLHKLSEIERQKNVEDVWENDKTVRGAIVSLTNPIMKEYAKKHWEEIPADDYVSAPLGIAGIPTNAGMNKAAAADIGVNTLMTGPFKFKWNPGTVVANNVAAPAARQVAQVKLNDKPIEDAAKDFLGEVVTNYATPTFVGGAKARLSNLIGKEEKAKTAQVMINEAANKARKYRNDFMSGTPMVKLIKKADGSVVPKYYVFDEKEFIKEVPDHVARKAANGKMISWNEWNEWRNIAYTPRQNPISRIPIKERGEEEKRIINQMREGAKKATQNEIDSKPWNEGLNAVEAAGAANIKPVETRFNWASDKLANSNAAKGFGNWWNNQLGRSQYAGRTLNQAGRLIPGGENLDLFSSKDTNKKKLSENDKIELEMLNRLRTLYKEYPEMYNMPKLPDKYKDFINEAEWNRVETPISIKDIF